MSKTINDMRLYETVYASCDALFIDDEEKFWLYPYSDVYKQRTDPYDIKIYKRLSIFGILYFVECNAGILIKRRDAEYGIPNVNVSFLGE